MMSARTLFLGLLAAVLVPAMALAVLVAATVATVAYGLAAALGPR